MASTRGGGYLTGGPTGWNRYAACSEYWGHQHAITRQGHLQSGRQKCGPGEWSSLQVHMGPHLAYRHV